MSISPSTNQNIPLIYYYDLYLANPNISTSDLASLVNVAAVQNSLNNILLTVAGEIPYNPITGLDASFGGYLWGPLNITNALMLKSIIEVAIMNGEPRAENVFVEVNLVSNGYQINILYNISNSTEIQSLTTILINGRG